MVHTYSVNIYWSELRPHRNVRFIARGRRAIVREVNHFFWEKYITKHQIDNWLSRGGKPKKYNHIEITQL